jgi:predicted dinucleotide-binding enzyme
MKKMMATAILMLFSSAAFADTVAIIGTGDVARALGTEFASQGHTIVYGSRKPDRGAVQDLIDETGNGARAATQTDAVVGADIVVLAVPGMLVMEIVPGLGDLSGKIIIDPTNPMERSLLSFSHAVETSNAQMIQAMAPDADVVKAFNTLGWQTMMEPTESGGPVSIPMAGDSGRAKRKVAKLAQGMGLDPIDLGGVENAHWIEGMLILWINNRFSTRDSFDYYLRKTP